MQIKTVGQLKKELENIDDDFEVEVVKLEMFRGHLPNRISHELQLDGVGRLDKIVIFSVGDEI